VYSGPARGLQKGPRNQGNRKREKGWGSRSKKEKKGKVGAMAGLQYCGRARVKNNPWGLGGGLGGGGLSNTVELSGDDKKSETGGGRVIP